MATATRTTVLKTAIATYPHSLVGEDPLPYGLAHNRKTIEAVIQFAQDQKILPRQVSPEEMFASNTLDMD